MRADRLLSILLLLQVHRRITARELAKRLEVSERTIHRDMEALSTSGIPVVAERGIGRGDDIIDRREIRRARKDEHVSRRTRRAVLKWPVPRADGWSQVGHEGLGGGPGDDDGSSPVPDVWGRPASDRRPDRAGVQGR